MYLSGLGNIVLDLVYPSNENDKLIYGIDLHKFLPKRGSAAANIIVKVAYEKRHAIVLGKPGKKPADGMVRRIRDKQLRRRIFQASFRGVQKAIVEKAGEYGVPVIYANLRSTSRLCPVRSAPTVYNNGSRAGRCSKGGELWHRDIVACWNLLIKARLGDGSSAPSPGRHKLDGGLVPLGSIAVHELAGYPDSCGRGGSPTADIICCSLK